MQVQENSSGTTDEVGPKVKGLSQGSVSSKAERTGIKRGIGWDR